MAEDALEEHARAPTTHDSTRYGLLRSSPRTFLAHHRAAISAAVVLADTTVLLAAPAMSFKLTMGMSVCVNLKQDHTVQRCGRVPRGGRLHDYWQQASKRGAAKEVRFPGFRPEPQMATGSALGGALRRSLRRARLGASGA